jgi:hypothetical protein
MFNPLTRRTDSSMTHRSTQRAGRDHRAETTTPVRAAATGNARVSSELEILLALGAAHGEQALVAALHRAVAFRLFRIADVRAILAAGAGTPQPRPACDAFILDLPVAPTRSLDAYKISGVIEWWRHVVTTTSAT